MFLHPLPIGFEVRRDGFADETLAGGLNDGEEALWRGRLFSCDGRKRGGGWGGVVRRRLTECGLASPDLVSPHWFELDGRVIKMKFFIFFISFVLFWV